MRIDLLAGDISSARGDGFARVPLLTEDPLLDLSRSDSDPEERPEDDEFDDESLVPLMDVRRPVGPLFLLLASNAELASTDESPRVWAVESRLGTRRMDENGLKLPSAS